MDYNTALIVFMNTILPLGIVLVVFGSVYLVIKVFAQKKERQVLAEQGIHPDGVSRQKSAYAWVRNAGLIVGMGVGFMISAFIGNVGWMLAIALVLIFSGLGMLGGFFLQRRLLKADEK